MYSSMLGQMKPLLTKRPDFEIRGIDFERAIRFNEINEADTSEIYFLSTGEARSIPAHKGSTVYYVSKSKSLNNRIIVMNAFCENCTQDGKVLEGSRLRFMKNEVQTCFSNCTNGLITLFDLKDIPEEHSWISEYGSLLLFTKNQY